jgi:hypothetical protein
LQSGQLSAAKAEALIALQYIKKAKLDDIAPVGARLDVTHDQIAGGATPDREVDVAISDGTLRQFSPRHWQEHAATAQIVHDYLRQVDWGTPGAGPSKWHYCDIDSADSTFLNDDFKITVRGLR